jgi:predicted lipase
MSFSKNLALKLAILSEKSYQTKTFEVGNKSFLLHEDRYNQYLIFTGSYEIKDWLENTKFVKVHRDNLGDLHNGFADTWDELRKEVLKRLNPMKKIHLAGHSLGGAVASIAALYLYNKGYNIESVYSFGSPRAGDYDWKKNFVKSGIEYYRVVNGDDLVPTMPKLFYWHVGKEVHINRRGFSWFHRNFTDHLLTNYIANLEKLG